jgi:uncharacterized membrane protein
MMSWLNRGTLVLALAGIGVASYLTYVHYDERALVCGLGDCAIVQASHYATIGGVPVAVLGLLMYLAVLGLAVLRLRQPDRDEPVTIALVGVTLTGTLYAGYLTAVELWVIDAICQWCVVSAVLTLALLVVETLHFRNLIASTAPEP